MRAGLSLGGNLRDRLACLTKARDAILSLPRVERPFLISSLYETEPVDCEPGASKFLNAVIEIGHTGHAEELLRELQAIEVALGRPQKHERNHSRLIDLDLLYHGADLRNAPPLHLPHPRLRGREFVLRPLAEIRPDLILPNESKTVRQLLEELPPGPGVVRASVQW